MAVRLFITALLMAGLSGVAAAKPPDLPQDVTVDCIEQPAEDPAALASEFTIGQIVIVGNKITSESAILAQLPFFSGQEISFEDFETEADNLKYCGIVSDDADATPLSISAEVVDADSPNPIKNIKITVEEPESLVGGWFQLAVPTWPLVLGLAETDDDSPKCTCEQCKCCGCKKAAGDSPDSKCSCEDCCCCGCKVVDTISFFGKKSSTASCSCCGKGKCACTDKTCSCTGKEGCACCCGKNCKCGSKQGCAAATSCGVKRGYVAATSCGIKEGCAAATSCGVKRGYVAMQSCGGVRTAGVSGVITINVPEAMASRVHKFLNRCHDHVQASSDSNVENCSEGCAIKEHHPVKEEPKRPAGRHRYVWYIHLWPSQVGHGTVRFIGKPVPTQVNSTAECRNDKSPVKKPCTDHQPIKKSGCPLGFTATKKPGCPFEFTRCQGDFVKECKPEEVNNVSSLPMARIMLRKADWLAQVGRYDLAVKWYEKVKRMCEGTPLARKAEHGIVMVQAIKTVKETNAESARKLAHGIKEQMRQGCRAAAAEESEPAEQKPCEKSEYDDDSMSVFTRQFIELLDKARCALESGDVETAQQLAMEAASLVRPEVADQAAATVKKARRALAAGCHDEAWDHVQYALSIDPECAAARMLQEVLFQHGYGDHSDRCPRFDRCPYQENYESDECIPPGDVEESEYPDECERCPGAGVQHPLPGVDPAVVEAMDAVLRAAAERCYGFEECEHRFREQDEGCYVDPVDPCEEALEAIDEDCIPEGHNRFDLRSWQDSHNDEIVRWIESMSSGGNLDDADFEESEEPLYQLETDLGPWFWMPN